MDSRFDELERVVVACGREAARMQSIVHRGRKNDGTAVTDEDLSITKTISEAIERLFPEANIVTEEMVIRPFDPDAPLTFVFDPIDGTDSYSQGFPLWCVGVGVLDGNRVPVGTILYSPYILNGRETVVRTDPESDEVLISGVPFKPYIKEEGELEEIALGSSAFRLLPMQRLSCRFRAYGSALLHILLPMISRTVDGAINPPCYVWDIAPMHAALVKSGMDMEYIDRTPFVYDDEILVERKKYKKPIIAGGAYSRSKIISLLS